MKKALALLMLLAMLLPAAALGDGPVLLVQLPQDAQMVENIEFDDGDFIQTYQLSGGANVQLLRYQAFDMTLDDLVNSEWVGCTDVRSLAVESVGGYPASGVRLAYEEAGQDALDVTLLIVDAGVCTLVYEAVFPQALGDEQISATVQMMIDSMDVIVEGEEAVDESAEVG